MNVMFAVQITEPAQDDIDRAFVWWSSRRSQVEARKWYNEIHRAILTLKQMPERCPTVPESKLSVAGVRQLLFGVGTRPTHRIMFVVRSNTVIVLRVRHHSEGELAPFDISS